MERSRKFEIPCGRTIVLKYTTYMSLAPDVRGYCFKTKNSVPDLYQDDKYQFYMWEKKDGTTGHDYYTVQVYLDMIAIVEDEYGVIGEMFLENWNE